MNVLNSQVMMWSKSEGVVARERMKGPLLLVGAGIAMVCLVFFVLKTDHRRCNRFCSFFLREIQIRKMRGNCC